MSVLWEPCAGGARIKRVFGDTPCPVVPSVVQGLPVTELGAYCFAEKEICGGTLDPPGSAQAHPITGNFVEEITLPPTLQVIDSAAFYNCRNLRRVQLGGAADSFGSDLFTNCRALKTIDLQAAPDQPTGLRRLLVALSTDITVNFTGGDGAELFFPEYFELLDENAPAHIFERTIEGEGYRMRQCFTPGGVFDFAAYDASFAQACVGESTEKLCRLSLGRLTKPFSLSADARAEYELYLCAHPAEGFSYAIQTRREDALRLLTALDLPTAEAAAQCAKAGWSAGAAILLGRSRKVKKQYTFDDL